MSRRNLSKSHTEESYCEQSVLRNLLGCDSAMPLISLQPSHQPMQLHSRCHNASELLVAERYVKREALDNIK